MALVASGAAVAGPIMAAHGQHGLLEFSQIFHNVSRAVQHFQFVRYTAVACLALAGWDRLILSGDRRFPFWPVRLSAARVLYIFNRYLNLCCLCLDVYVYTSLTAEARDCMWWFNFRSGAMIILLFIIETLVAFHLWVLADHSKYLAAFCAITITAQLTTCTALLGVHTRQFMSTPRPGHWFRGCFPVFSGPLMWPGWNASMVLLTIFTILAICFTFRSWRSERGRTGNEDLSFWDHAISCGLWYYIGITVGIWICAFWWMTASLTLVTIAPTFASTIISVLGCRLMMSMSPERDPESDESEFMEVMGIQERLGKRDIHLANDSEAASFHKFSLNDGRRKAFSRDPSPVPIVSIELDELTSRSDAATLTPAVTRDPTNPAVGTSIRSGGLSSRSDVQLVPSPSHTYHDAVELASSPYLIPHDLEAGYGLEGPSTSRLPYWQDSTEVTRPRTPPLEPMTFAAPTPPASPDIIPSEPTLDRRRYIHPDHIIDEEEVDDELDRVLAEEYDEECRRRRPKRTHQRRWKSDDIQPQQSHNPYAPLSSSPLNRSSHTTPSGRPLSSPISSSRPFSPPPSSSASRHRLSSLLHWNYSARTTLPEEEDSMSSRSVVPSLSRSRRSMSSQSGRTERVGGILGSRRSVLSRSSRTRAESDARTISSVSTDWVFDNTHVLEVPDFQ